MKHSIKERHVLASLKYKQKLKDILNKEEEKASTSSLKQKKPAKVRITGKQKLPSGKIKNSNNNIMVKEGLISKAETAITRVDNPDKTVKQKFSFSGVKPHPNLFSSKTVKTKVDNLNKTGVTKPEGMTKPTKTMTSDTSVTRTAVPKQSKKPSVGYKIREGETLFSMFDKPEQYKQIRAGHAVVPKISSPAPGGTKPSSGGGNVGTSPPAHVSSPSTPSGGLFEHPARPTHQVPSYSHARAFSAMFGSPATARAAAATRAGYSNMTYFRPSALTLRKSDNDFYLLPNQEHDINFNDEVEVDLQKSAKHHLMTVLAATGLQGAVLHTNPAPILPNHAPTPNFSKVIEPTEQGDKKLLHSISMVESGGGKYMDHPMIKYGIHAGTAAIGRFGQMPHSLSERYEHNPNYFSPEEHAKIQPAMQAFKNGDQSKIKETLENDANLDEKFAKLHLKHIRNVIGKEATPERISYSWNQGEGAGLTASHKIVMDHPYTKKFQSYYNK